jgi:hypothetical protein
MADLRKRSLLKAGALLLAFSCICLAGCGSSPTVQTIGELSAPLRANPDTSIFGPHSGTKSYDDMQVTVTNRSSHAVTVTKFSVDTSGAIDVTGTYLVTTQPGYSSPPAGISMTPFTLDGKPVSLRSLPTHLNPGEEASILVRAHLDDATAVGDIESVTLTYKLGSATYLTTYLMPTLLCA